MISVFNLSKQFGEFKAVDSLTFDVPKGAICAFLGPNGAGKSTTVKMLTGLLKPSSGTATVCGLDSAAGSVDLKRRIGVLPENLGLFDDLTVLEHLELTGGIYGLSKQEIESRAGELLSVLDLETGRKRFAGQCSHGMRKKTSLAMALLPNPEVLFLDEPLEAIDPVTSRVMLDIFEAAAARGVTIFFTSHILPMVEEIATQIMIIRAGRLQFSSPARQLPKNLESLYFELAEARKHADLTWLGGAAS